MKEKKIGKNANPKRVNTGKAFEARNDKSLACIVLAEGTKSVVLSNLSQLVKVDVPRGIKRFSIIGCPMVKSLIIPPGTTRVSIFNMDELEELILPKSIKELFVNGCPKLTKFWLSQGVR